MNTNTIYKYQRYYGIHKYQEMIDTGLAWHELGEIGRTCADHIKQGSCILPVKPHKTYWGQYIPSRYEVPPGFPGSYEYVKKFYKDTYNHSRLLGYSIQKNVERKNLEWINI